jgi:hypothetical protein
MLTGFFIMAKRFIDTGLFDDSWFMDLPKDCKLLWIYLITKCDHAGIIEFNSKLWQFQTGIKSIETVIKGLSNRLVTVNENYFFIPKFLFYQYPNFPNSKVRAQESAIKILIKYKLFNEENQTVIKPLTKGYVYDNDNGSDNDNDKKVIYFKKFAHLKITNEDNKKLVDKFGEKKVNDIYKKIENYRKNTNYKSLYLTALDWLKKDKPKNKKYETPKDQSTDFSDIKQS